MDHSGPMSRGDAVGDGRRNLERLCHGERPFGDPLLECSTLDQLHRHPGDVIGLTDVENGDDAGVIEGRGGAGLLLEAANPLWILGHRRRQNLDRHVSIETRIPRPIDLTHTPCTQRAQQLIRSESGIYRQGHVWADLSSAIRVDRCRQIHSLPGRRAETLSCL